MRRIEEASIIFNSTSKKDLPPKKQKGLWYIVYEWLDSLIFAILLILLVFVFAIRIVGVNGWSMYPTLDNGDWVTVSAVNLQVNRGDIVVITQPNDRNEPLIKRVIAVGGDTLEIDFDTSEVIVNGQVIDEPYINHPTKREGDFKGAVIIPEGYVFVMGDNRNDSLDSRFDEIGLIDERYILGAAEKRIYPFGEWEIKYNEYEQNTK